MAHSVGCTMIESIIVSTPATAGNAKTRLRQKVSAQKLTSAISCQHLRARPTNQPTRSRAALASAGDKLEMAATYERVWRAKASLGGRFFPRPRHMVSTA